MKTRLNNCKSKLNDLPLFKWHKHTKKMNPAGTVAFTLKKSYKPELLTQVIKKFFHYILSRFRIPYWRV